MSKKPNEEYRTDLVQVLTTARKFEQFLKLHNAYAAYLTEFADIDRSAGLCEWLLTRKPDRYITSAFTWSRTEQDFDYWHKLNIQWQNILKS